MSPRHSKAKVAANQSRIVQGTVEGRTQTTIASELGVTRETVNRNLAELRKGFVSVSREEFSQYVKRQVELLTQAVTEVWEGTLPPEAANSIRGLMDSIARLTGSNAPTKSISANVNVDAANIGPYRKFVLAVAGLEEVQIEELLLKAREMPRRPFVMVEPPKTSPLWTKNQLTEGDDEVA